MDVRDLAAGQVFDKVIADALKQSDVLVAVIGPQWMDLLSARMAAGGNDLLREEIATALKRKMIVIPVLIGRAGPPSPDALPDDIRDLTKHEVEDVRHKYFDGDMENVLASIDARRQEVAEAVTKGGYPRNSEELWLWLRDRPIEASRPIAARAALRQLPRECDTAERLARKRASPPAAPAETSKRTEPIPSELDEEIRRANEKLEAIEQEQLEKADSHILKLFRAIATAWFSAAGSDHTTPELKTAALSAARAIEIPSFYNDSDVAFAVREAACTVAANVSRTRAGGISLDPAGRYAARAAAAASVGTSDDMAASRAADLDWLDETQSSPDAAATPLWLNGAMPDDWEARWQRLREALLAIDPSWAVWITWYEDRVGGAPFDMNVERRRVLIPEEIWRRPPAEVNALIAQLNDPAG